MNITFEQFFLDRRLGGKTLDPSTRGNWLVAVKAALGEPLSDEEFAIFQKYTGRTLRPTKAFKENFFLVGRQGGKSETVAGLASLLALQFKGKGLLPIVASDRDQAGIVLGNVKEIFLSGDILRRELVKGTEDLKEEVRLKSGEVIRVMTCSTTAVRGYRLIACVNYEVAHWPLEDPGSDREVFRAQGPGRLTTGGPRITITTVFRRRGLVYEHDRDYYGKDDPRVLVWKASTLDMNDTADPEFIEDDMQADRESALCEYFCEYRDDLTDYIASEVIERQTDWGVFERPFQSGQRYIGFIDIGGGKRDSGALAIAHQEGDMAILEVARTWPAFSNPSPQAVIEKMSQIPKSYGSTKVQGDRYAANFTPEEFSRHGITYEGTADPKSKIYLDFLPMALSGRVRLLDNRQLREELQGLTRRPRTGLDVIDHGPRGFDDLINACAGALTLLGANREPALLTYYRNLVEQAKAKEEGRLKEVRIHSAEGSRVE